MIGLLLAVLVIPLGLAVSGTSGHQTSSATVVRAAASVGTTIGCQDRTYEFMVPRHRPHRYRDGHVTRLRPPACRRHF